MFQNGAYILGIEENPIIINVLLELYEPRVPTGTPASLLPHCKRLITRSFVSVASQSPVILSSDNYAATLRKLSFRAISVGLSCRLVSTLRFLSVG